MFDKVKSYIDDNEMIKSGDKVVVGVSGGADSTALLEILYMLREEYRLSLYVVHINHGIRNEAAEDAMFVRRLCEDRNIPFYLFEEDIPKLARAYHMSEEEMGRKYRYQCFAKVMEDTGSHILAVAHHMDDQAETVLFHMVRGTDLSGMSGMAPVSSMAPFTDCIVEKACIIRPFLNVRRDEITGWLMKRGMSWKEDITNKDDNYARNRIRNKVINELNEVNDCASAHIAEFAALCAEYDGYMKKQADAFIDEETELSEALEENGAKAVKGIRVNRKALLSQDKVIADRVIYELLIKVCGAKKDITREHVNAIYALMKKQSGRELFLPYKTKALVSYDHLIMEKEDEDKRVRELKEQTIQISEIKAGEEYRIVLSQSEKMVFTVLIGPNDELTDNIFQKNYTKYFNCDTIEDTLCVRYPKQDDYLVYDRKGHRKSLSKLMKDIQIPKNERMCQPVLASGHEILWVVGKRRCENHQLDTSTGRVLKVEYIL